MPSLSSKTKKKRAARLRKMGVRRKRALRHGSTPPFPIHVEEENSTTKKSAEAKE